MKKIETLKKDAQSNDVICAILNNSDIIIDTLTDNERLKIVVYNEIKKAIDSKTHKAVLQCNYSCTAHKDAHSFDLIRFVEREKEQCALCNIYIAIKKDAIQCTITVSAHKAYQDALKAHEYDVAKHRKIVTVDTLASEIKTLYAVFNSVNKDNASKK